MTFSPVFTLCLVVDVAHKGVTLHTFCFKQCLHKMEDAVYDVNKFALLHWKPGIRILLF